MIEVVGGLFLLSIGPRKRSTLITSTLDPDWIRRCLLPVEHEECDAEGDDCHPGHAADHKGKPGGVCRGLLGAHPAVFR